MLAIRVLPFFKNVWEKEKEENNIRLRTSLRHSIHGVEFVKRRLGLMSVVLG